MSIQFSSRHLLLATFVVAMAIGGYFWLKKLLGIDPKSETVCVVGSDIDANWQDHVWQPIAGLHLPATQFVSANWHGQARIKVHQPLLTIAYNNYLGQEAYRANVCIDGHRTDDWVDYLIRPMRTGGGINDGGTMVSCDHTSGKPTLTIVAVQYLNTERRAKRLELVFDRLRDTFALRKDTARGNSSHHILFGNEASSAPSQ